MLMFRVRGQGVTRLLECLETDGWDNISRLGAEPSGPGRSQVLLAEKLFLRHNATMGLVMVAEGFVSDEVMVTITTIGGRSSLLRLRLWADEELEEEAARRVKELAGSRDWQVERVEEYHHHS